METTITFNGKPKGEVDELYEIDKEAQTHEILTEKHLEKMAKDAEKQWQELVNRSKM